MCLEGFCGKYCEMHKSPVNCFLHGIAGVVVIFSLWKHSLEGILIGILIAIIGHIIQAAMNKKTRERPRKKKR